MKQHIKYRFRIAKVEFEEMQQRLFQVCKVIQDKNPSLVKMLCKQIKVHHPWGDPLDTAAIEASKKKGEPSTKSKKSQKSQKSSKSTVSKPSSTHK